MNIPKSGNPDCVGTANDQRDICQQLLGNAIAKDHARIEVTACLRFQAKPLSDVKESYLASNGRRGRCYIRRKDVDWKQIAGFLAAIITSTAHAATYSISTFDVGHGAIGVGFSYSSFSAGINDSGAVVGAYIRPNFGEFPGYSGFLRTPNGVVTSFDAPIGAQAIYEGTNATALNNTGQVVGYGQYQSYRYAFARDVQGGMTIFSGGNEYSTSPFGINDGGEIVGVFLDSAHAGVEFRSFFRDASGAVTPISEPGGLQPLVNDINNIGQMVGGYGAHGYLRNADGSVALFDVPSDFATASGQELLGTFARGISDSGVIVGSYVIGISGEEPRAFVRDTDGNFSMFNVPGAVATELGGINNAGQLVGAFRDNAGTHWLHCYAGAVACELATAHVSGRRIALSTKTAND